MFDWDEAPDLNITPLIDVMLVLMAIFMITIPVMHYEEKIDLPDGSQKAAVSDSKALTVRITKDLTVHYKNDKFTLESFPDAFRLQTGDTDKEQVVFINADKEIAYEHVMYLLKTVKESEFKKVSLLTQ
ncbi:MAG: Biopolymer transport protein ExbD/TolR [uncultured Sulfurovum sp.]|uniref:Biopolymer transport protein ExbD/TolR n=1 Tax=uncultured Sulfurovum sp. TaxID=269237 RepID=A0A6S6T1U2_9BACT|nr:MAG: Biopolymer transport protein ExbD/TolR [uncultured Sulfurovum sp.]